MDMKCRLSEWLNCAWFLYCHSDQEWQSVYNVFFKEVFFCLNLVPLDIYVSLRLLSPYRNSVYINVERFEVLSERTAEGQHVLCSSWHSWLGELCQAVGCMGRLGWVREKFCWGSAKNDGMREKPHPQLLWMVKWHQKILHNQGYQALEHKAQRNAWVTIPVGI